MEFSFGETLGVRALAIAHNQRHALDTYVLKKQIGNTYWSNPPCSFAGGSHCNEFLSTVSHPIWEVALVYMLVVCVSWSQPHYFK